MAYVGQVDLIAVKGDGTGFYGESQECVASVKFFTGAPQTSLWSKGVKVKGDISIKAGTAIATFDNTGKYKGHAAIYIGQNGLGILVYDQWNGREFGDRLIEYRGQGYVSNDGEQFYVIE